MKKILIIFFLFSLDIITKQWIYYSIELNNFISLNVFFDLAHIHNYGISFGLFSGWASHWFFIFIGLIVTSILFYMMIISKNNLEKWGILIIIAGAISNIIDRGINGYVIDFIYLHYHDFYWPAFNFADIYISIGICIIVLQLLKDIHKKVFK